MQVVKVVSSFGLSWQAAFGVITVLYFYSHYLFASGAAHIGAMYTAFLSVAVACGTPGASRRIPFPCPLLSCPSILPPGPLQPFTGWLPVALPRTYAQVASFKRVNDGYV